MTHIKRPRFLLILFLCVAISAAEETGRRDLLTSVYCDEQITAEKGESISSIIKGIAEAINATTLMARNREGGDVSYLKTGPVSGANFGPCVLLIESSYVVPANIHSIIILRRDIGRILVNGKENIGKKYISLLAEKLKNQKSEIVLVIPLDSISQSEKK